MKNGNLSAIALLLIGLALLNCFVGASEEVDVGFGLGINIGVINPGEEIPESFSNITSVNETFVEEVRESEQNSREGSSKRYYLEYERDEFNEPEVENSSLNIIELNSPVLKHNVNRESSLFNVDKNLVLSVVAMILLISLFCLIAI